MNKSNSVALLSTLAVAFAALLLGSAALTGGAVATVETNQTNFASVGSEELAHDSYSVDNDTQSLYVDLDNLDGNNSGTVEVNVSAIDSNGNHTTVDTVQMNASSGNIESYEYSNIDPSTYSEYHLQVTGNSTTVEASSLDLGTVSKLSGGGGFLSGSSTLFGFPMWLVLAVIGGGAYVYKGSA